MRIPQIPMEWMDPMSWRLPSGKALAEFALQAGFLAPLMLATPNFRKKKRKAAAAKDGGMGAGVIGTIEEQPEEGPETSGTFRSKTGRETGR
jgi:dihydroorotate dehydrogenase